MNKKSEARNENKSEHCRIQVKPAKYIGQNIQKYEIRESKKPSDEKEFQELWCLFDFSINFI